MIHLDTHVAVWLVAGRGSTFPPRVRTLLENEAVHVSPIVEMELAFLAEINRITEGPHEILGELRRTLGLTVAGETFAMAAALASTARYAFTRDPFDRLIGAHADAVGAQLITKDQTLHEHLDFAIWD